MKKGISTIIATIILVVITIGLIATAYLYFMGIVTVGPVVSIASARCGPVPKNSLNVTLTLKNEGTSDWSSGDLTFTWDGTEFTITEKGCESVAAGKTGICIITNTTTGTLAYDNMKGTHNLAIYGPRNTVPPSPITC